MQQRHLICAGNTFCVGFDNRIGKERPCSPGPVCVNENLLMERLRVVISCMLRIVEESSVRPLAPSYWNLSCPWPFPHLGGQSASSFFSRNSALLLDTSLAVWFFYCWRVGIDLVLRRISLKKAAGVNWPEARQKICCATGENLRSFIGSVTSWQKFMACSQICCHISP